jgi:hypothetical protein
MVSYRGIPELTWDQIRDHQGHQLSVAATGVVGLTDELTQLDQ